MLLSLALLSESIAHPIEDHRALVKVSLANFEEEFAWVVAVFFQVLYDDADGNVCFSCFFNREVHDVCSDDEITSRAILHRHSIGESLML